MKVRITTTVVIHAEAATRKQLARKYNIGYRTFLKWLARLPYLSLDPKQRVLTPKQVATIYKYLGAPE